MELSGQILKLLAPAALCGLVFLESWPVGQFLLGRPALLLPLVGWLFGMPLVGLWLGICLELLFLRELPMGSTLIPEPAAGGLVALFALHFSQSWNPALSLLDPMAQLIPTLLLALPLSYLMSLPTQMQRRLNTNFWHDRFLAAAENGQQRRFEFMLPLVVLQSWALASLFALLIIPAIALLWPYADQLVARLLVTYDQPLLLWVLAAISAAGMLRLSGGIPGVSKPRSLLWTGSGAAVGALLLLVLWGVTR